MPPSARARSVIPVIEPPVIATAEAACVAIVPRPRLVLAFAAVEAPVPPSVIGRSVVKDKDPADINPVNVPVVAVSGTLSVSALALSEAKVVALPLRKVCVVLS